MCENIFFQCIKGSTIGKHPAFLGLLYGARKIENPLKRNACAVNQKIVTAWFSGNALIAMKFGRIMVQNTRNLPANRN